MLIASTKDLNICYEETIKSCDEESSVQVLTYRFYNILQVLRHEEHDLVHTYIIKTKSSVTTKIKQHLFSALPSHAKSCLTQSLSVMLSHTANKALKFILFYDVTVRDEGPMSYCSSPGQVYVQRLAILNTVLQNTTTLSSGNQHLRMQVK